jgi:hypothetical protein
MGFLDHTTNNVILDAVLTDAGRQALSRNDGSFSFVKFALGDDEVDYTTIQKFGRTVGKEKIEKNTPVFEALTNQNFGQKFRMISVSNPNLVRLPILSLTGESITDDIVSLGATTTKTATLTLTQTIQDEDSVDVELRDQGFEISLNNDFLQLQGYVPDLIDGTKIATYLVRRDSTETSVGGSRVTFTLEVRSISNSQFTVFGTSSNKSLIRTFVKVRGVQSGAVKEFEVQINKNN